MSGLFERLAILVYRVVGVLVLALGVLALPFLCLVERRRKTVFGRLGMQAWPDVEKPVWVHALSVGELLSAEHLVLALRARLGDRPLVLSVSTLSGRRLAETRLAAHVDAIFYFPYDVLPSVHRAVRRVDPSLFVLIETDLWPGFMATLRRRGVPAMLLNGRLSPPTLRSYRVLRWLFRPALDAFGHVYPQSAAEATRFAQLGVERPARPGNLKFDAAGDPPDATIVRAMREQLGLGDDDRVLLAGSTHPGEEAIVADAWRALRHTHPDLRLVIVPRRPERGAAVADLFGGDGVPVRRWSDGVDDAPWSVLVVDEIGHLAQLYALADVAFVGGSLVPEGGHNPIEPAACATPSIFGPDMEDFPDVARQLVEGGGAIQVDDALALLDACTRLLEDDDMRVKMGADARGVVAANRGVTAAIVDEIAQGR